MALLFSTASYKELETLSKDNMCNKINYKEVEESCMNPYMYAVLFIYLFLEGKGERKRGRETSVCGCLSKWPPLGTWPATQACALTGNRTGNPLVCSPCSIQ